MALPLEGQHWPPVEWAPAFEQYTLNDALYTGAVDTLHTMFAGAGPGAGGQSRGDADAMHYNTGQGRGTAKRRGFVALVDSIRTWFWGRQQKAGQSRAFLHSPMAGNLASLSADVLMAEPPRFRFVDADGETVRGEQQDRLEEIIYAPGTRATLIQAAEYCAGLSAVALTVHWDPDRTDRPWLGLVACDAVIPEWEGGVLSAVNLWTTHAKLNDAGQEEATYYHVERHEAGQIVHALYLGGDGKLTRIVPLESVAELEYLASIPGAIAGPYPGTIALPTGIESLTATWWRNLPTRRFRKDATLSRIGRADCEGVEHWLDQIDMVWSSWMRDIKLARARLIVGSQMLDAGGSIQAPTFDDDAEILRALDFAATNPDDPPLEAHQFAIRAEEHARTILELTKEVLNHAGYSLASYGEHGDVQKTATEVVDRTTATERTRDKKALYFTDAFEPLLRALLEIDAAHYPDGKGLPADAKLEIEFPEQSQIDPEAQARTFQFLRSAMAASTKTLVTMLHDDWTREQIDEEVDAILEENNLGPEADPAMLGRDGEPIDPNDPDAAPGEEEPPPADEQEEEAQNGPSRRRA